MTLQISNLDRSDELVEMSLDEQTKLVGGVSLENKRKQLTKEAYAQELLRYARGLNSISSSDGLITFTNPDNNSLTFKNAGSGKEEVVSASPPGYYSNFLNPN